MVEAHAAAQRITNLSRTTVIVGASSFGFGPAGVALNIAAALHALGLDTLFVGDGAACELASRDPDQRILCLPNGSDAARVDLIGATVDQHGATAVVSSMSPEMILAAKSREVRSVWVESLLWWDDIPIAQESIEADLYIRNRSLPDEKRLAAVKRARTTTATPVVSVGPITWPEKGFLPRNRQQRSIVVNVGGLRESFGQYAALYRLYARIVTDIVRQLRQTLGRQSVLLVGPSWLADAQPDSPLEATPSQPYFVKLIKDSDVLVTAPGLGAPFEAWANGVPVVFLPPSNQSQIEQLRHYRALDLTTIPNDDVRAMPTLAEVYRQFAAPGGRDQLCATLMAEIQHARTAAPHAAIKPYLQSLGGTGTDVAATLIADLAACHFQPKSRVSPVCDQRFDDSCDRQSRSTRGQSPDIQ